MKVHHHRNDEKDWYAILDKPEWAPPSWLFGPVWAFLYVLIAISFGWVFWKGIADMLPLVVVLPFVLNIVFNFAFTPIQFKLKSNFLASIDILLVLGTLIWAAIAIYPHAPWVAYIQIPYVLWVCFATALQLTITYLNRRVK